MLEILEKLKAAIRARGGDNGIRTLKRILKRMDTSGDGLLSPEEFAEGLRDMGISAPSREVLALVTYFDTDRRSVSRVLVLCVPPSGD
jgi:Ca2+-binding EF-hand superfamily protein